MVRKTPIGQGKTKFIDPYQDVDIFSGPAGRVVVDVDPSYAGIQSKEDETIIGPGGKFDRAMAKGAKKLTEFLAPSEETEQQQVDIRAKNQAIFDNLLKLTGIEKGSFEASALFGKLNRDKSFQEAFGYDPGGILTGGGITDRPEYGIFDIGRFFFGDARKGLTSMVDEGTKFKELPFEQKLGIAILPIDAIDIGGLALVARGGLGALLRAGKLTFGKGSKKTVKDLIDDEQFMKTFLDENPDAIKDLENFGFDIQKRFQKGKPNIIQPKAKPGQDFKQAKEDIQQQKKRIEAEEIRKTAEGIKGFTGETPTNPNISAFQKTTGIKPKEFIQTLTSPNALLDDKTLQNFAKYYDQYLYQTKANTPGKLGSRSKERLQNFYSGVGEEQANKLVTAAEEKGLLQVRDISPTKSALKPEGQKYLTENYMTMPAEIIRENMNKNLSKYFYTDIAGNRYNVDTDSKLRNFATNLGLIKGDLNERLIKNKIIPIKDEFDKILSSKEIDVTDPFAVKKAFREAVIKIEGRSTDTMGDKFYDFLDTRRKAYNEANPDLKILSREELTAYKGGDKHATQVLKFYQSNFAKNKSLVDLNQSPEFRFFNNIERTRPNLSIEEFFELYKPKDIKKGGKLHTQFLKFKKIDETRIEAQKILKPILDKIFKKIRKGTLAEGKIDDVNTSLQIAHKYITQGIGDFVGKDKIGTGADPAQLIIDISEYNAYMQAGLESQARIYYNRYARDGLESDYQKLVEIDNAMKTIGVQGEIAPGQTIGRAMPIDEKISSLMIEAMNAGAVTQKDVNQAIKAANRIAKNKKDYEKMFKEAATFNQGGLVDTDMTDIFDEEDNKQPLPRITVEFGEQPQLKDIAAGRALRKPEPQTIQDDVFMEPMSGDIETVNLKLPFWKLFTKPPVNETAPIPTPKDELDNPTRKQKESLESEKQRKIDDVFDPSPEDNTKVDLGKTEDIAVTPKTKQPVTGVFYSDIERALARPDTPAIFQNKKAVLDFLRKNRIKESEFRDYQIESLLRIYEENTPIPKDSIIKHLRQSPIRGMHVHATGQGSDIINPGGEVATRYSGYVEPGFIGGTQRERVLYIPRDKIAGDSGVLPSPVFEGENISRHEFGIPNESESYIIGWSRLTDRSAILPTKIAAPKTQSKVPGLTRERERIQRQLAGLFAEGQNKLNAQAQRRGIPVEEIQAESLEEMLSTYSGTLDEISPGLVDQIDELIVKARDLDAEIVKGSSVDTSGVVRVAFADEIQSDLMQAAAGRKQKLLATLKRIQDQGKESVNILNLSNTGKQALEFFEKNKSVFRPIGKSEAEVEIIGERLAKLDAEVDEIITRFIDTRELDSKSLDRLKTVLNENIEEMINELLVVDTKTYEALFPDIPFKKREEWADALIKKDLFELAYRKFVLKDPDAPDYYSVTPDKFVIDRYNFKGNSATPEDVRQADKKRQIDRFKERGEFVGSEYKGIGMSEFYGGPDAVSNTLDSTGKPKHYTSVIEKILKNQAKSNNSEFTVLNVQTKSGGKDVFIVRDQNGNMVATLTSQEQATRLSQSNPNYRIETLRVPDNKNTTPSFAIKITEEMLEPYKTHKAKGGLVEMIDIFEVA